MNFKNILCLLVVFASFVSCKTSIEQPDGLRSLASDTSASEVDCGTTQGTGSSKDLNGEQIFTLSSRCVFNQQVHDIRIVLLGETFQKVLNDGCSNRDSGFGHVKEFIFDGHHIENVGIKTRGNTSNCNSKRQFKFKFDAKKMFSVWQGKEQSLEFPENKKRRFFGLAGYSLRASANDPSMIRERLASKIFTQTGTLAPASLRGPLVYRTSYAKLLVSYNRKKNEGPDGTFNRLIDGIYYDYKGFYTLAEHIDETFIESRFQNGSEKMNKFSLFQADLAKASFEKSKYIRKGWAQDFIDGSEPETEENAKLGDTILLGLFDKLRDDATEEQLAQVIDIESIVNYTAAVILTGHWDSLLANRNNDFLYFDGTQKKWKVIAWDLDNTMGALHDQYASFMSNDIYQPATKNKSRLFELVFSKKHPGFRAKLKERLNNSISGFYSESELNGIIGGLKEKTKATEPWEGINDNTISEIKAFAQARRNKIKAQ